MLDEVLDGDDHHNNEGHSVFSFILASSYFSVEPPLQYRYRGKVSPPSLRWIGVVPPRLRLQETTRVLVKAPLRGQIDWSKGLKENVIPRNTVPMGTSSQQIHLHLKEFLLTISDCKNTK